MLKFMYILFIISTILFSLNWADNPNCTLPRETGRCRGYFQRYGYDPETDECVQFVYGGCGGNGNNFETQEECENACCDEK